ncbi:hypothetical protein [Oceanicoccus sp. KOV_DT_Chl]|uniref:hypothetical protein n=1 Tax=Oceanicoccus sp. KOV_DT_Chl TaxID=1904639 RepID=UPI000C796AC1|nr:hypothetical protein [Oceanicoccus sp. KOV_DT_Chl]
MLRQLSLFLALTFSNYYAHAECDCLWQGSFSKAYNHADLIVSGTVVASKGNSADFFIDQTLFDRGISNKEFLSVIRFWGNTNNNKLCRPEISVFPTNTQWVLALKKIAELPEDGFNPNTPNISYGRINDYYISSCGAYWLKLEEGMVTGNLVKGRRWEWENKTMNPVLLELIDAYINNIIPEQALTEAAKPLTETKKLMEETKRFLHTQ